MKDRIIFKAEEGQPTCHGCAHWTQLGVRGASWKHPVYDRAMAYGTCGATQARTETGGCETCGLHEPARCEECKKPNVDADNYTTGDGRLWCNDCMDILAGQRADSPWAKRAAT